MTVVGLWGVVFCDRFEVEVYFLIFSTRRVSGAWPMLPLPLSILARARPERGDWGETPLDLCPLG